MSKTTIAVTLSASQRDVSGGAAVANTGDLSLRKLKGEGTVTNSGDIAGMTMGGGRSSGAVWNRRRFLLLFFKKDALALLRSVAFSKSVRLGYVFK
jgi:hypothetical protein